MKCFSVFLLLFTLTGCAAVMVYSPSKVDTDALFVVPELWKESLPATPANARLRFLYGNLKYPEAARRAAVRGTLTADFIIGRRGEMLPSSLEINYSPEVPEVLGGTDTLRILQFLVPFIDVDYCGGNPTTASPPVTVPAPPPVTAAQIDTGRVALVEEVARVLHSMPLLRPALKNNSPVRVRQRMVVVFSLE